MSITSYFYHGMTRKLIVAFGTIFNNITVTRKDNKVIKVPLTYASKETYYLMLKQNYNMDKLASIVLPRMGFVITNMGYDFERKQSSIGKIAAMSEETDHLKKILNPVPYNISIQLSIYSRNMIDGLQVLEQIIPFFKPSFNITILEIADLGIKRDIPITLESISHEDNTELNLGDGIRLLRWDLDFIIKANYYGPTKDQSIIKTVFIDYHSSRDGEWVEEVEERYRVSVDPREAHFDDVWEYEEEILSIEDTPIPSPTSVIQTEKYPSNIHFYDEATAEIV